MISFNLACESGHAFEGWFRNNGDFDDQSKRGFLACPHCGSTQIAKSLMTPAVSTGRRKEKLAMAAGNEAAKMMSQLQDMTRKMRAGAENVGPKFAEEARKIHFGEVEARGIYGEASPDEARSLAEDGVPFMPLPSLPEDQN